MAGSSAARANAVICNPSKGGINQYDLKAKTFAGIVAHPTSGTTDMKVVQADGTTTMTWKRGFNNGDPNDAQISQFAPTHVIFAVADVNTFGPSPLPVMASKQVQFASKPTFPYTYQLTPKLLLFWDRRGDIVEFQAVLDGLAWYVCSCFVVRTCLLGPAVSSWNLLLAWRDRLSCGCVSGGVPLCVCQTVRACPCTPRPLLITAPTVGHTAALPASSLLSVDLPPRRGPCTHTQVWHWRVS